MRQCHRPNLTPHSRWPSIYVNLDWIERLRRVPISIWLFKYSILSRTLGNTPKRYMEVHRNFVHKIHRRLGLTPGSLPITIFRNDEITLYEMPLIRYHHYQDSYPEVSCSVLFRLWLYGLAASN